MVPHKVRCPMKAWLPNAGVFATKVVVNRGRVAMLLALGRGGLRAAACTAGPWYPWAPGRRGLLGVLRLCGLEFVA